MFELYFKRKGGEILGGLCTLSGSKPELSDSVCKLNIEISQVGFLFI